jgi:hypothetical protein
MARLKDIEALERLHRSVFLGEEDYIPLLVQVPCPGYPTAPELAADPAKAVAAACAAAAPRLATGDDWIPTVNIGHYQNVVVPSLFGAEIALVEGSEPICLTHFSSAGEAAAIGIPELEGRYYEEMMEAVVAARSALAPGFRLSMPPASSPFDLAQLLLGEEFLVGLHTEPEAVETFLGNLTEIVIRLTRRVKAALEAGNGAYVTNRGLAFPGLRQPCDAIVNLSPAHLERFVLPPLERLGREFGALCVHYCSAPAPSNHVLPFLLTCPSVRAVDNWQGPEAFVGPGQAARSQDRIALVTDIPLRSEADIEAFFDHPAVAVVKRRRGRGLVIGTSAESQESARELLARWRMRQVRR